MYASGSGKTLAFLLPILNGTSRKTDSLQANTH
jgi:superfamily II DNA/RNA helicase